MNTKEKGDIAVGQAISFFVKNSYEVCLPLGNKRGYDLVVEKYGKLTRVQVKYAGNYTKGKLKGKCVVALRVMGGNQSYNYARKYSNDDFDAIFIYTEKNEHYYVPWQDIDCCNAISIECDKYKKYLVKN